MSDCRQCCCASLASKLDRLLVLQARQVALLEMIASPVDESIDEEGQDDQARFYLDGTPV